MSALLSVTSSTGPPRAGTRLIGALTPGANRIVPSGPHAPPRAVGASAITIGVPPATSIRFSLSSAKNPSDVLSGDQNGKLAPAVPGNATLSSRSSCRIQSTGT